MKPINADRFIREYCIRFKLELLPHNKEGITKLLASLSADRMIDDVRWAAYMLATVKHECANTWLPITEYGKASYFDKYNAHTPIGKRLGNELPGDGFKFRGRGYVQITGRGNYARLSKMLFKDDRLVVNPELTLMQSTAYTIMSHGMRTGAFTGKMLSDYIAGPKCDYLNARRIINGVDKAQRIAEHATLLEKCLVAVVDRI